VRARSTPRGARADGPGCITARAADAARIAALPPLAATGTLRTAAGEAGTAYLGAGWSAPEPWGTWTDADRARVRLPIAAAAAPLELAFTAHALAAPGEAQTVDVHANGERIATWTLPGGAGAQRYVAVVPRALRDARPALDLELVIARPVTPRALGLGPDDRTLGFALSGLAWRDAPVP
jgi:hypothetical protein